MESADTLLNGSGKNIADSDCSDAAKCGPTGKATTFLCKLHDMLDDADNSEYICWSEDGRKILIKDKEGFCSTCLLQYYDNIKFKSFVRQLHVYGFSKTKKDPEHLEWKCELFRRGERHLASQIKRRALDCTKLKGDATKRKLNSMLSEVRQLSNDIQGAAKRLQALEAKVSFTFVKCTEVQEENKKLWQILNVPPCNFAQGRMPVGADAV